MQLPKSANDILFRCSGLGDIIASPSITEKQLATLAELQSKPKRTEKQEEFLQELIEKREGKKGITDAQETQCRKLYSEALGRSTFQGSKETEKGNHREHEIITEVMSMLFGVNLKKNTRRERNEYITGEWDTLFTDSDFIQATADAKSPYSLETFLKAKTKPLEKNYDWQGVGYNWLSYSKRHYVVHALMNGLAEHIEAEKKNAFFRFGCYEHDPRYIAACKQSERNHIFDMKRFKAEYPHFEFHHNPKEWVYDLPISMRVCVHMVDFEPKRTQEIIRNVDICREWIQANLMT
jgi:hypothetical protein